jgi:polysaccharide export outer membrane protein/exopolysaccharide production protein ExoF
MKAFFLFVLAAVLLQFSQLSAFAEVSPYRLGPQDKVEIRIYDLRSGTGEAHKWAAFEGDFQVDAAGMLSLPLIGEVSAGGATTFELARLLAARVQSKVGLAQTPSASVQVVKYRPFYMTGAVEKPGEYDFRPGLTVIQAVSLAGGLLRLRDDLALGFERDTAVHEGELRTLGNEKSFYTSRLGRLQAESLWIEPLGSPKDSKFNQDLGGFGTSNDDRQLFNSRREAFRTKLAALEKAKTLIASELSSFDQKDAAVANQIDLMKKELAQVSGLVSRGLAVSPRQTAVEQNVAAYESNRIDIQTGRIRAQQEASRLERDILEVRNSFKNDVLTEIADVRSKIENIDQKILTAKKLIGITYARTGGSGELNVAQGNLVFIRLRRDGEKLDKAVVSEADNLNPGDVLLVEIPRSKNRRFIDAAGTTSSD